MKKLFTYLISGIAGGLIVVFAQLFINPSIGSESQNYVKQVSNVNVSPSHSWAMESFTEAAEKARTAVVHISAYKGPMTSKDNRQDDFFDLFLNEDFFSNPFRNRSPRGGSGSGVIYTNDGYIITNSHVIEFADQVEVTLYDNRKFSAEVIGMDKPSDLAVLKIDAIDLPILNVANSGDAKVGEWVLAVGNPFDLTSTVTAGIISAKGRNINLFKEDSSIETFIQTDAAVNPGNSGGALVNTQGDLIGINTAIATSTGVFSGYSFAIPSNLVTRIVGDLIKFGSYQRGYLGVHIYES